MLLPSSRSSASLFLNTETIGGETSTYSENQFNLYRQLTYDYITNPHLPLCSRTRALLCSVYHHALHDRYYVARDKLLMSHIQDNIDKVDTKTMILYNRALVTIGLSAFREGLVQKVLP